ncbi:HesA/MoeB/ThiF family protein [Anaerococcus sp. Marseille-P3915]|uniref:HesA/MoeB/ThiF family protein n=1 Tax=Anaerococcus sp. Marseille-P3915 TaxID=2057799 RepID=UPI000D0BD70A|nr:ThiF family adenylyltransferase [Anaerococcus sp. Marseille-P3915]
MENLFLNPYVSVLELKNKIYVKSYKDVYFKIEKKTAFQFLYSKTEFKMDELLEYFSKDEISLLKEIRLLLNNKTLVPDTKNMLSRQRGLFSIVSSNFKIFENNINSIRVLIVGAGAIGTHILWSLITIGVKNITILDFDVVEESNLNRQLFYGYEDIGYKKVEVLKKKINKNYPHVDLSIIDRKLESEKNIRDIIQHNFIFKAFDTPLEGTEWINNVCVEYKIPYMSGGFLNETGIVGPIYIPNVTPCYGCNEKYEGTKYNMYSPTFSPIVINVVSKMMQIFFTIVINKFEDISQYYLFNIFDGTWKEVNNETKKKCPICGREPLCESFTLNTLYRYGIISITGIITSIISTYINNYIPNYLLILTLICIYRKKINKAGFILSYSSILVTINVVTQLMNSNFLTVLNNGTLVSLIQNISFVVVLTCVMITVVSILWYSLAKTLNKVERKCNNVISKGFRKNIW